MTKFQQKLAAAAIVWAGATVIMTALVWVSASFIRWELFDLTSSDGRIAIVASAFLALNLVWKSWDEKQ